MASNGTRPVAVVTGASSGIGAATAVQLAQAGFDLVLGARRLDRLEGVAKEVEAAGTDAQVVELDVTSQDSVDALAAALHRCDVVVCNAGGALGMDPVVDIADEQWRVMWETNVLGLVRTVRAVLPLLVASGNGRVVTITSVAGHQVYVNGGGYTSAKHAAAAVTDTLRTELLGKPVRVIEVAPGMVETEFSTVRFDGDEARAAKVYENIEPLTADDVAEAITWAVTRRPGLTVARLDLFPRAQSSARDFHRDA